MCLSVGHDHLSLAVSVHVDSYHDSFCAIHRCKDRIGHCGGDMRIDIHDSGIRDTRLQLTIQNAALVETEVVDEYHRQQLTAGATQWYIRALFSGSSAFL